MEKEVKKETTQQQAPATRGWRDVLSARNAELNLDDDAAVGSYLDESFQAYDKAEEERKQFNEALSTDPRSAGILTGIASGVGEDGEPFSLGGYLIQNYDDILDEYYQGEISKEEAVQRAKERDAQRIKEAAEAEARKKTADENLARTDQELTKAMQKNNIDEANVSAMLDWLYGADEAEGFIHRVVRHELDAEDWGRLIHAFNIEADAEAARAEGKAAMRQQRSEPHRNAKNAPTYTGGGGSSDTAPKGSGNPTADLYSTMKRKF